MQNFVTKNNVEILPKPEMVIIDSKPELIASAATGQKIIGIKRMNDQEVQCDTEVKKPHLNGDTAVKLNSGEDEVADEGKENSKYEEHFRSDDTDFLKIEKQS